MTYWAAPAIWPDETAFIVCGGPSLAGFDFNRLAGQKVIAVNSSVFAAPFADVCFFGDMRWWAWNQKRLASYAGLLVTTSEMDAPNVKRMEKRTPPPAICAERTALTVRNTSLTGAINLAFHFGASKLVLLGADMGPAEDGRTHHHDPHPIPQRVGCWDRQMNELKETIRPLEEHGIAVVNTSLRSRISWWPKRSIDEVLP